VSKTALQISIDRERESLAAYLCELLAPVAAVGAASWDSPVRLDAVLQAALPHIGGCKLVYAVNCDGRQYSANISSRHIDESMRGQDLAVRPYMQRIAQEETFVLSPVYVDKNDRKPCVTGIYKVLGIDGEVMGCIAADYDLAALPGRQQASSLAMPAQWRQIKGDPAIRQNLFQQERVTSAMDEQLDQVNDIITDLLINRGVFHAKLHYSSSRATLWLYEDPHRYRLHVLDEIIDPSVCLAYPRTLYPADATVDADLLPQILNRFAALRRADSTVYLRAASLNIVNGMVGLNFSCDGSHYMSVEEFLSKGDSFWFGCD